MSTPRQTIRSECNSPLLNGNPLVPAAGRPNARTRLPIEFDAPDGTLAAALRDAALMPFASIDARDAVEAAAVASGLSTTDGVREHVKQHSYGEMAKVKRVKNVLAKADDHIRELEKETALPPPDESGDRVRGQIFRQLMNIPQGPEREREIMRLAAQNPAVADALREMPRELSGVAASTYDLIVGAAQEKMHGPKLAELHLWREQAEVVRTNVAAWEQELAHGAGVFSMADWAAETANIHDFVPWLRKKGDRVIVVDLEKRIERAATEQDLERGRFFGNFDEFKAANE
jgi:hypothetical protein